MRSLVLLLALVCSGLAGCMEGVEKESFKNNSNDEPSLITAKPPAKSHLIDYYYWAQLSTDFVARDSLGLCDQLPLVGSFTDKWEMERLRGHKISENHTYLNITVTLDELFSQLGVTGHRIGIFYGDNLMLWSDAIKESLSFNFPLNSIEGPIDDSMVRFFIKLTDPTTEENKDACTSGIKSGSVKVDIYAA